MGKEKGQFVIRRYRHSDRLEVQVLNKVAMRPLGRVWSSSWPTGDLDDIEGAYLKDGDFLVGEFNGRIVAMGGLKKVSDGSGKIRRMRVHPKYQGRGYGRAVLAALENIAKEMGYERLTLSTTEKQKVAQSMYLNSDYREIKRERIEDLNMELIYYEKDFMI